MPARRLKAGRVARKMASLTFLSFNIKGLKPVQFWTPHAKMRFH
jgi:hypothetical protein